MATLMAALISEPSFFRMDCGLSVYCKTKRPLDFCQFSTVLYTSPTKPIGSMHSSTFKNLNTASFSPSLYFCCFFFFLSREIWHADPDSMNVESLMKGVSMNGSRWSWYYLAKSILVSALWSRQNEPLNQTADTKMTGENDCSKTQKKRKETDWLWCIL